MDPFFVLTLATILSAILILLIKVCFASKCEHVKCCWGMFSVDRQIEYEVSQVTESAPVNRHEQEI